MSLSDTLRNECQCADGNKCLLCLAAYQLDYKDEVIEQRNAMLTKAEKGWEGLEFEAGQRIAELEGELNTASQNFSTKQAEWWDKEDKLQATNERLRAAIRWALGEEGDFGCRLTGNETPYWWRTELRQRARMVYDRETYKSRALREDEDG